MNLRGLVEGPADFGFLEVLRLGSAPESNLITLRGSYTWRSRWHKFFLSLLSLSGVQGNRLASSFCRPVRLNRERHSCPLLASNETGSSLQLHPMNIDPPIEPRLHQRSKNNLLSILYDKIPDHRS